jgi:hypothetical protein
MATRQTLTPNQRDGYNEIHDMFTKAKTTRQLQDAVEKAVNLIPQYNLDSLQQTQLEEYGIVRYNALMRALNELEYHRSHNRR